MCHSTKFQTTLNWFKSKNSNSMDWLSLILYINPIKNLQRILFYKIYAKRKRFRTINKFKSALFNEEWTKIDKIKKNFTMFLEFHGTN